LQSARHNSYRPQFDRKKSKRATKEKGTRISCIATAMQANPHKINFVRRPARAEPVSFLCLLRQVSSASSRNCSSESRRDHRRSVVWARQFDGSGIA